MLEELRTTAEEDRTECPGQAVRIGLAEAWESARQLFACIVLFLQISYACILCAAAGLAYAVFHRIQRVFSEQKKSCPTGSLGRSPSVIPPGILPTPAHIPPPQLQAPRPIDRAPKIVLVSNAQELMDQPQFLNRQTYGQQGPVDVPLTGVAPYEAVEYLAQRAANTTARGEVLQSRPGAITSAQTYNLGMHTDQTGHEYHRLVFLNAAIGQHNPQTGQPHTIVGAVEVHVYAAPESQGTFWYIESPHPSRAALSHALKDYSISQMTASTFPIYTTSVRPPLDPILLSHDGVDAANGHFFVDQFPIPREPSNNPAPEYDHQPVFAHPRELGIDIINSLTEHNMSYHKRVYQFWRVGPNVVGFQKPLEWEFLDWDHHGDRIFREFLPNGAPLEQTPHHSVDNHSSGSNGQVALFPGFHLHPKIYYSAYSNELDLEYVIMQIPDASDRFSRPESIPLPPPPADEPTGLQLIRLSDHFARTVHNYRAGHNIPNAPVQPRPITPYTQPPSVPSFHVPTKPLAIVWDSDSDDASSDYDGDSEADCECDCVYYDESGEDAATNSEPEGKDDDEKENTYSHRQRSPPPPPPTFAITQSPTPAFTPPPIRRALLENLPFVEDEMPTVVNRSLWAPRFVESPSPLSLSPVGRATINYDPTPITQKSRDGNWDLGTQTELVDIKASPKVYAEDLDNTPRAQSTSPLTQPDRSPFHAPRLFVNARLSRLAEGELVEEDPLDKDYLSLSSELPALNKEFGKLHYPHDLPLGTEEPELDCDPTLLAPAPPTSLRAAFDRLAATLRNIPSRPGSPLFKPNGPLQAPFPLDEDKEARKRPYPYDVDTVPEYLRHPQVYSVRVPDIAVNPVWLNGPDAASLLFRTDDLIPPSLPDLKGSEAADNFWDRPKSPSTLALEWEYPAEMQQADDETDSTYYDYDSESSDYQGYRLLARFDQEETPSLMSFRPLRTAHGLIIYDRAKGDQADYGHPQLGEWPIAARRMAEIKVGGAITRITFTRVPSTFPAPLFLHSPTHNTPPPSLEQLTFDSSSTSSSMPALMPPSSSPELVDQDMDSDDSDSSDASSFYSLTRVDNAIHRRHDSIFPLAPVGRNPLPANHMILSPGMTRPHKYISNDDGDEPAPKRQKIEDSLQELMQADFDAGMLVADKWEDDIAEMMWLRVDTKLMVFRYTAVIEALGLRDRFRSIYFPFPESFPIREVYELFLADLTANHDGTFQRNAYHRNGLLHDAEANFLQAAAILFRETRAWELAQDCERILGMEFKDDAEVVKLFRAGFFCNKGIYDEDDPQSLGERLREIDADQQPNNLSSIAEEMV
ncbi:hypothetical protein C8J57DRAFT_1651775 [Mycena rebaudengoi]|nr:hypothetical protein C8J57DRAFT_1651775 [Mycena rebaudengoi]